MRCLILTNLNCKSNKIISMLSKTISVFMILKKYIIINVFKYKENKIFLKFKTILSSIKLPFKKSCLNVHDLNFTCQNKNKNFILLIY